MPETNYLVSNRVEPSGPDGRPRWSFDFLIVRWLQADPIKSGLCSNRPTHPQDLKLRQLVSRLCWSPPPARYGLRGAKGSKWGEQPMRATLP